MNNVQKSMKVRKMSENIDVKGQCLCGAVKLAVKNVKPHMGVCHCSRCRKWAGGPSMAIDAGTEVEIEGEENITRFDSTDWCERAFCKTCGSNLFARIKEPNHHYIQAGLFDGMDEFEFTEQIFIDEKPKLYDFSNKTKNMTGQEVFDAFMS